MNHINKQNERFKSLMAPILVVCLSWVVWGCSARASQVKEIPDTPSLDERARILEKEVTELREVPIYATETDVRTGYLAFLERHSESTLRLRAPALKRLGDMHMKSAHERFLHDMATYDLDPDGLPPVVDYQQAIDVYNALLRNHPDYAENDQVLYTLSRAYDEMGEKAHALPLLEWLVNSYVRSPHLLEAHFRLGEYYFDRGDFKKAAVSYAKAASWKDPFFQEKALYKLGWSYFNLKSYYNAIDQFLAIVDQKTEGMAQFAPEEGSLVWESLGYVTTAFRNLGGSGVMAAYFENRGHRPYEKDLYLMMGNHYMVEKQPQLGIKAYRAFTVAHPLDPVSPFFVSYILEAQQKLGDMVAAEAERSTLIHHYRSQSEWSRANDEDARNRVRPLIQTELHRLALSTHAKALKNKEETQGFRDAADHYRLFLAEFPDAPEAQNIHFLLGETLMSLKEYIEAGAVLESAAYDYSEETPDEKAAYAAVVAYDQVKTSEAGPKFVQSSERYAGQFPKNPKAPVVLFNAAEFLYVKEAYSAAAEILENLIVVYPKHSTATTAKKLSAHSYMKSGDFKQARRAYARAVAEYPKAQQEEKEALYALQATAIYKEAELQKKDGKFEEAALLFQAVSEETPASELAPEALFEAALLYETLTKPKDAIRVYQKLAQGYPSSNLAAKSNIHAGLLYEASDDLLQASSHFVLAAQSTQDEAQAQALLWRAGLYYEKAGAPEKVISTFLIFVQRFPNHVDRTEAFFKMAETRQKQGRKKAAMKLYDTVIVKGPETVFAAKARFYKAERAFEGLKAVRLNKDAAKKFKTKTQRFKAAVQRYTETVETGHVEVVTVSAFRLGEVFEHFKSALLNAERPKNLNEEQMEEYLFQLEEKAYPFEEKAITAYESNVRRARQSVGLYNEWVKKSFARLAELRPSLYRREERSERVVSNIDPLLLPTLLSLGEEANRMVQVK